jgi:hypothetical protein
MMTSTGEPVPKCDLHIMVRLGVAYFPIIFTSLEVIKQIHVVLMLYCHLKLINFSSTAPSIPTKERNTIQTHTID